MFKVILETEVLNFITDMGDGLANEDTIGRFVHRDFAAFWVIDAATSITDNVHVPGVRSDPAWFAATLSRQIEFHLTSDLDQDNALAKALCDTADEYYKIVSGSGEIPLGDRPVASLSFVTARPRNFAIDLSGQHFGDCSVFFSLSVSNWRTLWHRPSGDRMVSVKDAPGQLQSLRDEIQSHRAYQNTRPDAGVVSINPAVARYANRRSMKMRSGGHLVLMSDGFARLFNCSDNKDKMLLDECIVANNGEQLMIRLREDESRFQEHQRFYKVHDDASLIAVRLALVA